MGLERDLEDRGSLVWVKTKRKHLAILLKTKINSRGATIWDKQRKTEDRRCRETIVGAQGKKKIKETNVFPV